VLILDVSFPVSAITSLLRGNNNNNNNNNHNDNNNNLDRLVDRPVVGILAYPTTTQGNNATTENYIAASYVKWLEGAGARSIPIPWDASNELVDEILSQVNGVLYPGGADVPTLSPAAHHIWETAQQLNVHRQHFPIWGTCLGFELLLTLASGTNIIQSGFDAENISLPLLLTDKNDGVYSSQLYESPSLRHIFSQENVTMNNHQNGIEPKRFESHDRLTSFFHITSTNVDRTGRPFVSTVESIRFPYYATQYHPEKNEFEFATYPGTNIPYEAINHSDHAIHASFSLAEFFVRQLRRNKSGSYTLPDRHPLVYTYPMKNGLAFEQIFLIPDATHWKQLESTMYAENE